MLVNDTPFAAQELFLTDEDGRDLLAVVVKATYDLGPGGRPVLAEAQRPVDLAGTYHGDPETSSPRTEPEVAPFKPATDVVLVGHAHAPGPRATYVDVGFQVGPARTLARVFGDRVWYRRMGIESISDPQPFERVPLTFERAFGGWDRTPEDPDRHVVERRNPVGVGYHPTRHTVFTEGAPLPNVEDPRQPIRGYTDTPAPVGFGFTGPGWLPRASFAGTYDEAWVETRMPLLPKDFDRRFYNAAPPGQIAPGYLRGDEPVLVVGASAEGRLQFSLPGTPPPHCTLSTRTATGVVLPMTLDTVVVDTDDRQVVLLWRGHTTLPGGPHAIQELRVAPEADAAPASV